MTTTTRGCTSAWRFTTSTRAVVKGVTYGITGVKAARRTVVLLILKPNGKASAKAPERRLPCGGFRRNGGSRKRALLRSTTSAVLSLEPSLPLARRFAISAMRPLGCTSTGNTGRRVTTRLYVRFSRALLIALLCERSTGLRTRRNAPLRSSLWRSAARSMRVSSQTLRRASKRSPRFSWIQKSLIKVCATSL